MVWVILSLALQAWLFRFVVQHQVLRSWQKRSDHFTLAGVSPPASPHFHELLLWAASSCVKQEFKTDTGVSRIKLCLLVITASLMRPAWEPQGQGFGFVLLQQHSCLLQPSFLWGRESYRGRLCSSYYQAIYEVGWRLPAARTGSWRMLRGYWCALSLIPAVLLELLLLEQSLELS